MPNVRTTAAPASASPAGTTTAIPPAAALLGGGGLLWMAAAFIGGDDGTTRFYVAESVWLIAQVALLAGTVRLWRDAPHGTRRSGAAGFGIATIGRVLFVVAEALALATGQLQEAILPAAAMATAIGTVVAGVAIVRAGRWRSWARTAPLVAGLFPFVAMFPFAATSAEGPPALALAGWGATFVLLGLAARASVIVVD